MALAVCGEGEVALQRLSSQPDPAEFGFAVGMAESATVQTVADLLALGKKLAARAASGAKASELRDSAGLVLEAGFDPCQPAQALHGKGLCICSVCSLSPVPELFSKSQLLTLLLKTILQLFLLSWSLPAPPGQLSSAAMCWVPVSSRSSLRAAAELHESLGSSPGVPVASCGFEGSSQA